MSMKTNLRKKAIERCSSSSGTSTEMMSSLDTEARDDWYSMSMARHADVVEFMERARMLMKRESNSRLFNSDRTASRHVINHENVTSLIIKYLQSQNLLGSAAALEAESNIRPPKSLSFFNEELLQNLIVPGLHDVSSILAPEGREVEIDEELEQAVYDFQPRVHQEKNVGQHISVWEDEPESEKNIVLIPSPIDPKSFSVKCGTFNKILVFLTSETPKDLQIRSIFLATYSSYCSSNTLMTKLIERFNAPEGTDPSETKQVQLRVVLIFKAWLEGNPEHFTEELLERLRQFISNIENEKLGKNLRTAMAKMQSTTMEQTLDVSQCPDPLVPKNIFSPSLVLEDVPLEEVARQLTLIDHRFVKAITLSELITNRWMSDLRKFASTRYNVRFNTFVRWCIGSVLKLGRYKDRAEKLAWLIKLANILFGMKSYSSCFAIYFAISHGSVSRLSHTMSALPKDVRFVWKDLCQSLDPSCGFSNYREIFSSNKPPRVPFLGAHYQELVQIEASSPDFVEDMINFEKRKLQFEAVDEVLRYASVRYSFLPVKQVQVFLEQLTVPFPSEEAMYRQSQRIEPKGITASELVEQEKLQNV